LENEKMLTIAVIAFFLLIRFEAPWYFYLLGAATAFIDLLLEVVVFLIALKTILD